MNEMQDQYLIKAEKLIFVSPEYNGSFPGSLKHFLDVFSVREYKPTFSGKKAALIGVAGGRAGNLRGMDHLTGVLMHVGTSVYPNRLPLSSIGNHVENDRLTEVSIQKTIDGQIEGFLNF
jgi:NAD(P)H-dependent FMN reductase